MDKGFLEYGKVGRLGQQDTEGILEGCVYVQPKLDGTNASVWVHRDTLQCGSRKRVLSMEADNAGFHAFVRGSQEVQLFMADTKGRYRLYGEWLVPHTVKGYMDSAWRKFYVFDVYDHEEERWLTPAEQHKLLAGTGIICVPFVVLTQPSPLDISKIRETMSRELMAGSKQGEGIVVKNYDFINRFGDMKHAKYLCEDFSVDRGQKVMKDSEVSPETQLAKLMTPPDLCKKTLAKVTLKHENWDMRYMPEYLETVWHDAVCEELYDALKKFKGVSIKMKGLKAEVFRIAREHVLNA